MNINIRWAQTDADYIAAFELINELARFEQAPQAVSLSIEQFMQDGKGERALYRLLVATVTDEQYPTPSIVGMALFYGMYSTWKGKIIYLDDLVVTETYRQYGIGQRLIDAVFAYARQENAQQVRWHVLDWNTPAIRFYEKLGAIMEPEWITCKVTPKMLEKMSLNDNNFQP